MGEGKERRKRKATLELHLSLLRTRLWLITYPLGLEHNPEAEQL